MVGVLDKVIFKDPFEPKSLCDPISGKPHCPFFLAHVDRACSSTTRPCPSQIFLLFQEYGETPQKTCHLLHYEAKVQRYPCGGPRCCTWRQNDHENPWPPPIHAGQSPLRGHTQSSWERWVSRQTGTNASEHLPAASSAPLSISTANPGDLADLELHLPSQAQGPEHILPRCQLAGEGVSISLRMGGSL